MRFNSRPGLSGNGNQRRMNCIVPFLREGLNFRQQPKNIFRCLLPVVTVIKGPSIYGDFQ